MTPPDGPAATFTARPSIFRSIFTAVTWPCGHGGDRRRSRHADQTGNREFTEVLIPNSDILEYFCAEGERDAAAIDGDPPTLLITYSGRDPANMIKSLRLA
jgi:hypothetical protein